MLHFSCTPHLKSVVFNNSFSFFSRFIKGGVFLRIYEVVYYMIFKK